MSALIAFSMFPAVTLVIAGLARAERRLTDTSTDAIAPTPTPLL